ncbi:uncharacterized protein K452DRAFT_306426 [Aplosporella prunicola CBS 121167]|uniref:Uncharacterized protein n=1 Tax=Aplosporella prunicola CBS 121167 TaxID=1176127 RepID=A0A6A6BMI9_9PEZI|nr:uncharacterized protein K452DRAFT_306426 [Aplosporella prunicola CBS 121167]KAF2144623.1 hypothetical protein K452DRAFT_306426 [Aplosporella prunicola CBS 121167]
MRDKLLTTQSEEERAGTSPVVTKRRAKPRRLGTRAGSQAPALSGNKLRARSLVRVSDCAELTASVATGAECGRVEKSNGGTLTLGRRNGARGTGYLHPTSLVSSLPAYA